MSGEFAPGAPAPSGLRGTLRSWLRTWSSEFGPLSEDLPADAGRPITHSYGSVRVLVADDNPVNLMMISALMESRGLVPVLAADGAEAVALACELQFDLILMDLQMPILDGLGATAAIRRFENTCSRSAVPVLAYSNALPGAGLIAAHGMNGSLAKPCEDHELEDCLVRWCPTYRSAPLVAGVSHHNSRWQAANQDPDSSSSSLR
ncbi:MAG: response regulator [Rubrivivax sp.]|nr:response regulator [Rubrivivax sp.]